MIVLGQDCARCSLEPAIRVRNPKKQHDREEMAFLRLHILRSAKMHYFSFAKFRHGIWKAERQRFFLEIRTETMAQVENGSVFLKNFLDILVDSFYPVHSDRIRVLSNQNCLFVAAPPPNITHGIPFIIVSSGFS